MEFPVLITLEEDKFEALYSFFSDPRVIFAVVLGVVVLIWIVSWLVSRMENRKREAVMRQFVPPKEDILPAENPEVRKLLEREARIRSLESSAKGKKLSELESREKALIEKQLSDGTGSAPVEAQARKVGRLMEGVDSGRPPLGERDLRGGSDASVDAGYAQKMARPDALKPSWDYSKSDWGGEPKQQGGYPTPSAGLEANPELEKERRKLKKMIEIATEKYGRGEMDKEAFMRIETDYYKKLIDLEVQIREEGL